MTRQSRRTVLAGGAATAGAAFVPKTIYAQSQRKVTFTQAWLPDGSNLFIYAGKQKGLYKSRGIDLEISRGYGSVAASQAVGTGKFDVGMAAVPVGIQQNAKNLPLVHFGAAHYDSTMGVAVLADLPIKTPKDLEGRKLGSTVTSGEYPFLPLWAKNAGLDLSKVQRVQLDAQVRNRALITKEVDAISAFAGSSIPSLAAQGIETRFFNYSRFNIPLYGLALMAKPEWIKADPGLAKAIAEASMESLAWALKEPDAALDAYAGEVKEVAMTASGREQAKIGFGMYAIASLGREAKERGLGWQDPAAMTQQTDLVMEYVAEKADKKPPVESLFTNDFVGNVKLSDAEWGAAERRFEPYRKYIG
jgi:NitT/TauT family transport system substrate-binding protein